MASSAFKSTTKRSTIGTSSNAEDAGSSNRAGIHRRSRSLSRFSGRFLASEAADQLPTPRGKFVNTVRGSGFPEISLDDLANEFFLAKEDEERESSRGRLGRRASKISPSTPGTTGGMTERRGRSVSRHSGSTVERGIFDNNSTEKGIVSNNSRRRRSVSVARYRCSDSESDMDHSQNSSSSTKPKFFGNGNCLRTSSNNPTATSHQCVLRRSLSQRDLMQARTDNSNYSSALTDEEASGVHYNKNGIEKIIRAVYAQKKSEHPTGDGEGTGLYDAMRKEVRHAIDEIRTELEQGIVKTKLTAFANGDSLQSKSSDVIKAIAEIRKNYTSKLEESEKRKQDLLAELAVEEQHGRELSKIVRELLPEPKQIATPEKPSRARKKSNDRTKMSKRLNEEAEKYFEDFISNVEDTDISSFDGEKSDTSSTLGGGTKLKSPMMHFTKVEAGGNQPRDASMPIETDGVVLPWLRWETSNDIPPLSCKKMEVPGDKLSDTAQNVSIAYKHNNYSISSHGSWSPGSNGKSSSVCRDNKDSRVGEAGNPLIQCAESRRGFLFDMDEYLHLQRRENLLLETLRHRPRIDSGGLILCHRTFM